MTCPGRAQATAIRSLTERAGVNAGQHAARYDEAHQTTRQWHGQFNSAIR